MIHTGMQKIALTIPGGAASRLGRFLARGPGAPAAVGALAASGAAYATRPEGADTLSTVDRVGRAGLAGAAAGAGLGFASRRARDLQLLNPGKYTGVGHLLHDTGASFATDAANVLKRQVHGMTGAYGDRLDSIGLRGRETARKEMQLLKLRAQDQGRSVADIADEMKALKSHGELGEAARHAGITSLPGTLRGLVVDPKGTGKALVNDIVGGPDSSLKSRLAIGSAYVGIPAVTGAMDLARGDESEVGGPTIGKKLLRHGANMATGVVTAGMPIGAGMAAQDLLMRPFGG